MNFTSPLFTLAFLPAVVIIFILLRQARPRQLFLSAASLLFYAVSGAQNLALLLSSIAGNYLLGLLLVRGIARSRPARLAVLWAGVACNLGVLAAFKLMALEKGGGAGFRAAEDILIPLALSFITFQQAGFLYACYSRQVRELDAGRYLFFMSFFPQLVMGPIVRYPDLDRQIAAGRLGTFSLQNFAVGLSIFGFGLVKKVLLADNIFVPVDRVFVAAAQGGVSTVDMWFAVIAFQLQLFLDFSAYADMAIGMGKMFNIDLPVNFDQPLFARDRFDLWRRWHISFSIFMRSHVFRPLVRHWKLPTAAALAVTGMLSGLWHGLGWTFVLWGTLQTALMLAAHYRKKYLGPPWLGGQAGLLLGIASTFLANCLLGVVFRTPALDGVWKVYGQLFVWNGGGTLLGAASWLVLALCAFAVWVWPDTSRFFHRYWTATDQRSAAARPVSYARPSWIAFELSPAWALLGGLLLFACAISLSNSGRFIYAQF